MKYLEYMIVEDVNVGQFTAAINKLIGQGWEPHGSLMIMPRHDDEISDGFFQAMVRVQHDKERS